MWEWNDYTKQDLMIESEIVTHNNVSRRRQTRVVGRIRMTARGRSASNAPPLSCNAGFQADARIFNTESGHIFGLQLGGVNESENVVPMYAHVNRGLFRDVERAIVGAYDAGNNYGLEYRLAYEDANEPRMPTSIRVVMLRNLTIGALGEYTADTIPRLIMTVRQDPPVVNRIVIDPNVTLLFAQAQAAVRGGWSLETSDYADQFRGWVEKRALPPVDQRRYAFLDYMYLVMPPSDLVPMGGLGTMGIGRPFSDVQRDLVALANRYAQSGTKAGECWSDAPGDPIQSALLQLGSDSGYEIDHIMPMRPVGANMFSNAQLTSRRFNGSKSNTVT